MSIRLHLIVLVLFCAAGGLLLGVFLIDRQHSFGLDNAALMEVRTQVHDVERLEDQTKQLLISIDLLFGQGETYLLNASRSGAHSALGMAKGLLDRIDDVNRQPTNTIIGALIQLQREINLAEKAAIRPSFSITNEQLDHVDELASNIVKAVTELSAGTTAKLDAAIVTYQEKRSQFDVLAWGAVIAYLLSLLVCLWLSSRSVSAPLAALSASARHALTDNSEFVATPEGPTEVRQLAASIGEFVDSLEDENARGNALIEAIPDTLFVVDKHEGIVSIKPGSAIEDSDAKVFVDPHNYEEFLRSDQGLIAQRMVLDCIATRSPKSVELKVQDGENTRVLEARASAINNAKAVVVMRDRTRKYATEQRIRHMAYHDSLTGLLNRRAFKEALEKRVATASNTPFALFFVDADRFKIINDTHGHDMGDEVLKHITHCIQDCLRASDTVSRKGTEEHDVSARMGGDEFVVLLQGVASAETAERVAKRLQNAVATPLVHDKINVSASITIGAALYPAHGSTADELMHNADAAMYEAKRSDVLQYCVYDEQLAAQNSRRLEIESKLSSAITRQDFYLLYQPKLDLQTQQIIGVEALVRWKDGDASIPPNEFIPIAEETGLIVRLGEFITKEAIQQMAAWRKQGFQLDNMAINVSTAQLAHPHFYESVVELAQNADVPNSVLNIEITESLMLNHYERATKVLDQFRDGGFSIALDDFGTGYSSLSYIKDLPLNVLKIDQAFVAGIGSSETERSIIATIIQLGKTLGLKIVAEGVETREQAEFLQESGCDQAQGYYFSKAVSPEEIGQLLAEQRRSILGGAIQQL